jgi:hypothetical protein
MGTGGHFPGAKARSGRDADHSFPSSAEFGNEYELYTSSPSKRLHAVKLDSFNFLVILLGAGISQSV